MGGRNTTRSLGALLAALLTMSLVVAPQSSASDGSSFNVPNPWGSVAQRTAIVRTVENAIDGTPKGEVILIASYLFDRKSSVDALIRACRRGVSVRVVLDGHIGTASARRLVRTLNSDNISKKADGTFTKPRTGRCGRDLPRTSGRVTAPLSGRQIEASLDNPTAAKLTWGRDASYVKRCRDSCRGNGALMHAKFYVFSRTGQARNVIMVSSSNLNEGGVVRGWNDMATFSGRPKSFAKYLAIHLEMTQDDTGDDRGRFEVVDGPYISRFFPWPGVNRKGDPVMQDLNKIGCRGANGRTQVRVSMFYWKGTRGNYIATKLLNLARSGCDVGIIYGAPSLQIAGRLRDAARSGLIALYDSRWWLDEDPEVDVRTHSKYVLVNGRYGGAPQSWQVMMGTANWVPGSLVRADENSLNISSAQAWRAYNANWQLVRSHSRRVPAR